MDAEQELAELRDRFAARLKGARKALGLTQVELGDKLSERLGKPVADSLIGNYEQGIRLPENPLITIYLADILGCDAAYLMGLPEPKHAQREEALLTIFRGTDERGKAVIFSVAESQPAYPVGQGNSPKAREAS